MYNFAFFIAGYGKPNPTTLIQLIKLKTKYPIFIVVGTDDPKLEEYRKLYKDNLVIFNKNDYIDKVDNLGIYAKTHKICTYSRLAVDNFARANSIRYVGYLFDDIFKFRLRYNDNGLVRSICDFDIDKIVDIYIELLNSSKDIVYVGPPNSAFYIGIDSKKLKTYSQRFGDFFIYDIKKGLVKDSDYIKSSVLEDMSLCLYNNMLGRMVICPGGLQVSCRPAKTTNDVYKNMDYAEYYTQYSVINNGRQIDLTKKNPILVSYKDFTPKIIEEKSALMERDNLNKSNFRDDFAIFILSHSRPNNVKTIPALRVAGYTGKWYIICDNEDKTIDTYYSNFGKDHVIVFNKLEVASRTDMMDLIDKRNTVVIARNVCHEIAKKLNLTYFLELEDDYEMFRSRIWDGNKLGTIYCKDFNSIVNSMIEFLDESKATTVAFAQTGDFIGGVTSRVFSGRLTRKAMNSFFCRVDKPFKFLGRMNDDVNAYTSLGSRGELFFTVADFSLDQPTTQASNGGNTDMYKEFGTYVKSFYSVMCSPSCVKIAEMGPSHSRIHHLIDWEKAVPKIISERFKK